MDARTGKKRWAEAEGERKALASVLLMAGSAVYALVRFASWAERRSTPQVADGSRLEETRPPADTAAEPPDGAADPEREDAPRVPASSGSRRVASSLVFAALFFAGAALSAVAGDTIGSPGADGSTPPIACAGETPASGNTAPPEESADEGCETGETETGEPTGETETGTDEPPADQPQPEAPTDATGDTPSAPPANDADPGAEAPAENPTADEGDGDADAAPGPGAQAGGPKATPAGPPLLDGVQTAPRPLDPEAHDEGAVVWLHRVLPDPTPPARRLAPAFARDLRRTATGHRIPWSLVLAVVRAHGNTGRVPVGPRMLVRIAGRLAAERDALGAYRPWHVALRYSGRTAFADRTLALDRYNRAVGLRALVSGLAAAKPALARRVLGDPAIEIYTAGRADIAAGRTDVRVLALLRYLRIAHGGVTVSSLTSGHRIYARPGVVSAHVHGLAVDIAALGGRPIAGNQNPGGLTERAVRDILLLPAELAPQQVISRLGLGGPSFPLADHGDHIHVGF